MTAAADREQILTEIAEARPGAGGIGLHALCRRLREGLGVEGVRLRLASGEEFGPPTPEPEDSGSVTREVPLYAGEVNLGVLAVASRRPPGDVDPVPPQSQVLLTEIAALLGQVLLGVRLQQQIDRSVDTARGHAERVAAVRRRALGERDVEREHIERDLHDGAQHHLVALGMSLGLLELHAQNRDATALRGQLRRLVDGLDRAEESLLSIAGGSNPLLAEAGVYPALVAEFQAAGGQVRLDATDWEHVRYDTVVEMAVYFICLEAVNNARKHAPGNEVQVRIATGAAGLEFSVTDTGPGISPGALDDSSGVANMRRRIVAAGGQLQVRTASGLGTTVRGFIPW